MNLQFTDSYSLVASLSVRARLRVLTVNDESVGLQEKQRLARRTCRFYLAKNRPHGNGRAVEGHCALFLPSALEFPEPDPPGRGETFRRRSSVSG